MSKKKLVFTWNFEDFNKVEDGLQSLLDDLLNSYDTVTVEALTNYIVAAPTPQGLFKVDGQPALKTMLCILVIVSVEKLSQPTLGLE
jgi:hypothetical protein